MESNDFQHIATAVRPLLMNRCRSFFKKQEMACDAEDAVQEALMRLWQMKERLNDYQRPEALAMLIAKNVCINMLRAGKKKESIDAADHCIGNSWADQELNIHDTERLIHIAFAKLPTTQRRMLMMRSEGMSMAEIAAACGTTPQSAKTMICNARKVMMDLLKIRRART